MHLKFAPPRQHRAGLAFALLIGSIAMASCAPRSRPVAAAQPDQPSELVVLAHGMGRTPVSMLPLELALEHSGYRVLNFGYSSYSPGVAQISEELAAELDAELSARPASRVHFVGHSLGNIVIRQLLSAHPPSADLGRFVMLAPPNHGSAAADRFAPYLGWLLPPISELKTEVSTVTSLPPPPEEVDFAIIVGRWDGKVSRAEACLAGAEASIIVASGHTFVAMRPSVIRLVQHYLDRGVLSDGRPISPACSGPAS